MSRREANMLMCQALAAWDVDLLRRSLALGADPQWTNAWRHCGPQWELLGEKPLPAHMALRRSDPAFLEALASAGASLWKPSLDGRSIQQWLGADEAGLKWVELGGDPWREDSEGACLALAAARGAGSVYWGKLLAHPSAICAFEAPKPSKGFASIGCCCVGWSNLEALIALENFGYPFGIDELEASVEKVLAEAGKGRLRALKRRVFDTLAHSRSATFDSGWTPSEKLVFRSSMFAKDPQEALEPFVDAFRKARSARAAAELDFSCLPGSPSGGRLSSI